MRLILFVLIILEKYFLVMSRHLLVQETLGNDRANPSPVSGLYDCSLGLNCQSTIVAEKKN